MRMKIVFLLLSGSVGFCKTSLENVWTLERSNLEYTVNFPLKTIKGKNHESKGKADCKTEKSPCEFIVGAEMKKFDSGDSNRDLHMQEATKAALHPVVSVHGFVPHSFEGSSVQVDLEVEFAGVKKLYPKVPLTFVTHGDTLDVEGEIKVSLKNHSVRAPSLLGVPIDDEVPLKISTHWVQAKGSP